MLEMLDVPCGKVSIGQLVRWISPVGDTMTVDYHGVGKVMGYGRQPGTIKVLWLQVNWDKRWNRHFEDIHIECLEPLDEEEEALFWLSCIGESS